MFFYYQNLFLEPKLAGDELLWVEPEPIFFYLEPEPQKKYLVPEPGKNGSAPQHFTYLNHKITTKLLRFVTFPQETMTKRS